MSSKIDSPPIVESDIPARLDRLPWSRWHWLVVIALGITWVLDGLEIRGLAIAMFYAAGTLVGGVAAPFIFGLLIQTGSRTALLNGYLAGAGLMVAAAVLEAVIGVKAERKELEEITAPLSSIASQ